MTRLDIQDLRFAYPGGAEPDGRGHAIRGLDLRAPAGRITALLGPSGSGKSTVLKLVAGLLRPSAGDILFDGRSVVALPPERREAALVPQEHLLFPHMTVQENVAFGLRMRGRARKERRAAADAMLERVGLPSMGARRPTALSGGQRQRVALARALVGRPRLLLLDEPLASLDVGLRDRMRRLVAQVQRDVAVTTLLVTHDREDALALADRIAAMSEGRVLQLGRPRELYERPLNARVARLLGPVSLLPGVLLAGHVSCAFGSFRAPEKAPRDGPVHVVLRPESVELGTPPHDGPNGGRAAALVRGSRYHGDHHVLNLSLAGVQLRCHAPSDAAPATGATVMVRLRPGRPWVIPR